MKLTQGAVGCLARGAAHKDPDVNAVGPNGDLFEAGQMVTEGDADLRRTLDIDEYRPVLEVVSTNWCGRNFTRWNEIGCLVTDGEETIFMKACYREKKKRKHFLRTWCGGLSPKLVAGRRFTLMDYTTEVRFLKTASGDAVKQPVVFAERLRIAPKKKVQFVQQSGLWSDASQT